MINFQIQNFRFGILLIIAVCLSFQTTILAKSIRLNEVVSSNTLLSDKDGSTPDWFELYNTSEDAVSLEGWMITDHVQDSSVWVFPKVIMEPHSYLFIWASGKDTPYLTLPRTLIQQGDDFKYLIPTRNIYSWKTIGFDDSNWATGPSGFGFGDNDDATVLQTGIRSVYARKEFEISNVDDVKELILHMDYDDSFVAYINDVEIARSNINGDPPAYSALALGNREAEMYNGGKPEKYIVENHDQILTSGKNVLSVEVHNVSQQSTDLSLIAFLSAYFSSSTVLGTKPPEILELEEQKMHTNFRVSSEGETLYLFNNDGLFEDSIQVPNIPSNTSYGFDDDKQDYVNFLKPTPEKKNEGEVIEGVLAPKVSFSHPGGETNAFYLTLTGIESGESLHYTLDATEPTENSPKYLRSISIQHNTVVRTRIFKQGYIPSPVQSATYILDRQHDLPITTLTTHPEHLFNIDSGMYVLGRDYQNSNPHFGANFWEDWEKPMHVALINEEGEVEFSVNAGAKIFGGWSRANDQRSFALFARKQYGARNFPASIFPRLTISNYEAFVLRNSGNDWMNTMMRDAMLTNLMTGSGLEFQEFRPSATYVNGDYWGFYNIREKVNEHFLADRFGIDDNKIDLLETSGVIIQGSNQEYMDLLAYIESNDLANDDHYAYVAEQVDIENYIMYQLAQVYFNNTDWPGNNIKYWKHEKGKWRWILYDTDFGFGIWDSEDYKRNTLAFAMDANGNSWPNPPWSTFLLRNLAKNKTFRHQFINQFADELNSRFRSEKVIENIDSIADRLYTEIPDHFDRWNKWNNWDNQVEGLRIFAQKRVDEVEKHIVQQFNLQNSYSVRIQNSDEDKGYIKLNSLTIKEENWMGTYYRSVPIQVTAVPMPGYKFSHWTGTLSTTNSSVEVSLSGTTYLVPHFEKSDDLFESIVINEINYNSSPTLNTEDWIELYNPNKEFVDLSSWVIKDSNEDHQFAIPEGTLIEPDGYLIIAESKFSFQKIVNNSIHVVGDLPFGFATNEDAVKLYTHNGELQDSVRYTSFIPWPTTAVGTGATIELIRPDLDNTLASNWTSFHSNGSPGMKNDDSSPSIDIEVELSMHHYPNPSKGDINIALSLKESSALSITMHDLNGKLVTQLFSGRLSTGNHSLYKDLSQLPKGVYIVKYMNEEGLVSSSKWIKI